VSPDRRSAYLPVVIDTSAVELPEPLAALVERLAENAHEVWARRRLNEGWRYGPTRDDEARRHPCLVPYGELSEPDRDIDRRIVAETMRAILALGYRISHSDA
jgi:hypothetical protein